jgi:hypothetical protein
VFWVISVYFNIRNTLPKFFTFLPGHPVYLMFTLLFVRVLYVFITGNLSVLGTKQASFILKVDCKVRDDVNGPS